MTHPATLLKNSWHAYLRDFRAWLALSAPIAVLVAIFVALSRLDQDGEFLKNAFHDLKWVGAIILIIFFIIAIIAARTVANAVIIASYRSLNGGKPNIKESFLAGFRGFLPVLWVSILRGLIIIGGLLLFVVPGIIWSIRYSLAVQAAVIEGKRGMDALHRSKDLTRGKLLETAINFFTAGIIIGYGSWLVSVIAFVLIIGLGAIVSIILPDSVNGGVLAVAMIVGIIAEAALIWLSLPLSPLVTTSIYKDFSDK
jgi:hypothetical protein